MNFMIKNCVEKYWPLPEVEKRHLRKQFLPRMIYQHVRADRDADYLCYLAAWVTLLLEAVLVLLMLLDVLFQTDIFLNYAALELRKLNFLEVFLHIMCKIIPVIVVVFYLRIRLVTNLEYDLVPFILNGHFLKNRKKKQWLIRILPIFLLAWIVCAFPELGILKFLDYPSLENDALLILLTQIAIMCVFPLLVPFLVSATLVIEKTLRFFPQAQQNLNEYFPHN